MPFSDRRLVELQAVEDHLKEGGDAADFASCVPVHQVRTISPAISPAPLHATLPRPSTGLRLAFGWPSTGLRLAFGWPSTGLRLAFGWPSTSLPTYYLPTFI